MRVAVVAGPDAGHAIPAIELSRRFAAAGHEAILFTGERWFGIDVPGVTVAELKGLAPRSDDDDADAGAKIHGRAAHIATEMLQDLSALLPDLVVSDVITAGGGMAAERLGIPWIELSPHPLYLPSRGLPPIGSGLAVGTGAAGRLRDTVLRAMTASSVRKGVRHRADARIGIGLPARDPGPCARLVATVPALEVPRPDWPAHAHVVGPLLWEPTDVVLEPPSGTGPLVMVAPSTATTGVVGLVESVCEGLSGTGMRVAATMLDPPAGSLPDWAVAGRGRQDVLLRAADVVVCGGGHGMLAKALSAGVPAVIVPGEGDQWELANRAARQGSAVVVRPLDAGAVRTAVETVLSRPEFAAAARAAAATAGSVEDPVAVCEAALR
ncbi:MULTISPECIES: glycosyltransferase [unclassified Rhodococcus (in: high G+C Gram-positive bacteria)]|uniref:glycosyltransferase n=1 Tax=unclassified Rhodococcus (in: high G+C Gram-positive bacteria) TaxID=192944 RepID=UPI0019DD8095|nr:nucleotide disphospho-sugar-binding domain-containing protein [Rhodococcus sp. (in: high G+C Gram-positive bacteria)]MBF0662784.1 glycosyl transferase [Rhodococcus sp. (in: high G+C Gram-positive bacteria)]